MRDKEAYDNTHYYNDGLAAYMDQASRFELLNAEEEVELAKQIEAGIYATHLLEVDESQQEYDQDYKQALGTIALEGHLARQQLISANTRLAISKAVKYKNAMRQNQFSDLINNANLGLIEAASTFDYKRGVKFSTYASLLIEQSLYQESNETDRTIRIPKQYLRSYHAINKIRDDYELIHGQKPSDEYVAQQLQDTSVAAIRRVDERMHTAQTASLNQRLSGSESEDTTLMDLVTNQANQVEDSLFETESEQQAVFSKIHQLIDQHLKPREATILRMYYGLSGEEPMTLQEIGDEFDLTRERVRQINKKSTTTLLEIPEFSALKAYFEA